MRTSLRQIDRPLQVSLHEKNSSLVFHSTVVGIVVVRSFLRSLGVGAGLELPQQGRQNHCALCTRWSGGHLGTGNRQRVQHPAGQNLCRGKPPRCRWQHWTGALGQVSCRWVHLGDRCSKDFVPVAFIGRVPFILVISANVPADSVKTLLTLMKTKGGNYNYGSSGMGNTAHLFGELFQLKTGVVMQHIPYKSSAEALQEVVAGRVQIQFGTPVELLPQISRSSVKALAVAGSQRLASLPSVPTLLELGLTGFESPTWFGVIAPSGTPDAVITLLNEATQKALNNASVKARLDQAGVQSQAMSPDEFTRFINSEVTKWEPIVRDSGAHLNP